MRDRQRIHTLAGAVAIRGLEQRSAHFALATAQAEQKQAETRVAQAEQDVDETFTGWSSRLSRDDLDPEDLIRADRHAHCLEAKLLVHRREQNEAAAKADASRQVYLVAKGRSAQVASRLRRLRRKLSRGADEAALNELADRETFKWRGGQ